MIKSHRRCEFLVGGCLLFGEEMPWRRLAGICVAMVGIVWYSVLKLQESAAAAERLLPSTANGPCLLRHMLSVCMAMALVCTFSHRAAFAREPVHQVVAALSGSSSWLQVFGSQWHSSQFGGRDLSTGILAARPCDRGKSGVKFTLDFEKDICIHLVLGRKSVTGLPTPNSNSSPWCCRGHIIVAAGRR